MATVIDNKSLAALEGISKRLERWLFDHMDGLSGRQFYNGGLIVDSISSFIGILSTQISETSEATFNEGINKSIEEPNEEFKEAAEGLDLAPNEFVVGVRHLNVTD